VGVFCFFVCVLLVLLRGLGYNLSIPLKVVLLVEIIVVGFRSSPSVPLRSLAMVLLQQPSLGGCCFYWLGLFEYFCHFIPPSVALGKVRLVYDFSGIIDDYHCLLFFVCVCFCCLFRYSSVGL
jgi:hypothetical protein